MTSLLRHTNKLLIILFIAAISSCQKSKNQVNPTAAGTPTTRVYYIAAEEVVWDYAPQGYNVFMGMPFDGTDSVYAVNSPSGPDPRIGSKNIKARFIEYTDATFTIPKPQESEWQHLGILGPVIRAVVGDSVVVYFKNKTSIHTTMHVHGLEYNADNEGSLYNNGTTGKGDDILPGASYTYQWYARESSGPTDESHLSSTVWLYHSHAYMDESDIYAGLVGAIIVTKKGMADQYAKPIDVDREFVTFFMVFDENGSALLQKSTDKYCHSFGNPDPDDFEESNKKHSINGMFMGNLPGLDMNKGERVRWYVIGLGNEVDLHTPHWHGNTVKVNGATTDVVSLLPAAMVVADMVPDQVGTWGYHCHVSDHMIAGMTALYRVH